MQRDDDTGTESNPDIRIVELLSRYMRHCGVYYRKNGHPTSEIPYIEDSICVLKRLYGRARAADFRPRHLKACRNAIIQSGVCRSVVNGRIARIKRVFRWAADEELIPASVYHGVQSVKPLKKGRSQAPEAERVTPIPLEHVNAVLPYLSRQIRAMIELQLLTGARPGEIRVIRATDITMDGRL